MTTDLELCTVHVLAGMMVQPRGLSVGPEATLQLRMAGLLGQVQPGQSG